VSKLKLAKLPSRTTSIGNQLRTVAELHRTKRIRGRALQERNQRLRQRYPFCVDCAAMGEAEARRKGYGIVADEFDHVKSLDEGGVDDESNLAGRCLKHHREKSERERVKREGR
jgi:5-methylcytosine-specific restriction protein A